MKTLAFLLAFLPALARAQTCPTPAQLATDLDAAAQGAVLSLSGVNTLACPEVAMTHSWTGGKLIFSDSPETVPAKGRLYEDGGLGPTVGTVYNRIHVHHVNGLGGTKKMKLAILIKNADSSAGTLTLRLKGTAGPTTDYLYAGKLAFSRWLASTASSPVNVAAGATVKLTTEVEAVASGGQLVTGLYDYSFDRAHKVTICAVESTLDPLSACPGLAVLARDSHHRGTFPYSEKVYDTAGGVTIDTAAGIVQFPVAGGTVNDPFAQGVDVTDGSPMVLAGNYGVLYRMHLSTSATDGKKLGLLINPRGGSWGGAVNASAGLTPGGKFLIPAGTGSISENTKAGLEGKYNPGGGLWPWLQFMPCSASNFPVRILAVPY